MGIAKSWIGWFKQLTYQPDSPKQPISAEQKEHSPFAEYGFGSCGKGTTLGNNVEIVGAISRIRLGKHVRIGDGARLVCSDTAAEIIVGDGTFIQPRAILETGPGGRIELGAMNSINPYTILYGHGGLITGEYVRIAAHTVVIPANHVFDDPDIPIARQGLSKRGIRIGRDVWIGSGCQILDGVEIGNGCVVAAGAVVNRNLEPFSVVGGVPARVLKMRRPTAATLKIQLIKDE